MVKTDDAGMQCLPLKFGKMAGQLWAIYGITQQRMMDVGHMDANLMGAPGFETAFDMVELMVQMADYTIMRDSVFAPIPAYHRHPLAVNRMSANGGIHRPLIHIEVVVDDGVIAARDGVDAELPGKGMMRQIGFTGHQGARRILVDAVDDAGTHDSVDARQMPPAVV